VIRSYEDFKKEILRLSGIDLNSYKERQMKRRIDALIRKNNYTEYDSYVSALKRDKELYNEFINYLTINVSEFYRNPNQWKVLESEVIPYLLQQRSSLKIWSAACSTGDEPYSLAMVLSKFLPLSKIRILATDIDRQVLEKAQLGLYNKKSLAGLPNEYASKYFKKVGESYQISDDIKRCIEFKQHNLLKDSYPLDCDLIVCRNVLIYFTEEAKSDIYKKFNHSLKMGGILFVGSTEQIILSHKYQLTPLKTFFYKKDGNA
jgi:chemotaxis protein methyltransferase CheR